jgi:hypothetical protein
MLAHIHRDPFKNQEQEAVHEQDYDDDSKKNIQLHTPLF